MLFIAGQEGLEKVQQDPAPRDTHPVRLVLAVETSDGWDPLRESAYPDVEAANTDLEYMGTCEGCLPSDIGFGDDIAY